MRARINTFNKNSVAAHMVKVVWEDEDGEHEEFFTEVASACCHFIWKRWPCARINLATRTVVGKGEIIVARLVYDE